MKHCKDWKTSKYDFFFGKYIFKDTKIRIIWDFYQMHVGSWDIWELLVQNLKFAKERVQGSKGLAGLFLGFQGLKVVNNPTRLQEVD